MVLRVKAYAPPRGLGTLRSDLDQRRQSWVVWTWAHNQEHRISGACPEYERTSKSYEQEYPETYIQTMLWRYAGMTV